MGIGVTESPEKKRWSSFYEFAEAVKPSLVNAETCDASGRKRADRPLPAASPPLVLSLPHTYTQAQSIDGWEGAVDLQSGEFKVRAAIGGQFVQVTECKPSDRPKSSIGKRSTIKGFSRAAMMNMLAVINGIDRSRIIGTFFVTQTIPHDPKSEVTSDDWRSIERRRRAWVERFRRRFPDYQWFILWKKEPHKSGHVHLHMLIFFLDRLPHLVKEFRPFNDQAWAEVCGVEFARCRSEFMRGWSGVVYYCAKYCAKVQAFGSVRTGKIWGVEGRANLLSCTNIKETAVSHRVGVQVKRALRKLQARRRSRWLAAAADGKWIPLKDGRCCLNEEQASRWMAVSDQVEYLRSMGVKVKFRKGRACRRRKVYLWAVDEDGSIVPGCSSSARFDAEQSLWYEVESYAPSTHFIDSRIVQRLLLLFCENDQPDDNIPF